MKTWIKRSLIGLAVASALGVGAAAVAHRQYGRPMSDADFGRMKARAVERIADHMDLNAAQRQQLDALGEALLAQRKAMLAGSEPRAALQTLVSGPVFDRAGAQTLLMAKTDALRAGAPTLIAAFGDFYDSLDASQQAELRQRLARGRHHGDHDDRD